MDELIYKTNNVDEMNLSELKSILHLNKTTNKLDEKIIKILKQRINNLILESNKIEDTISETDIQTEDTEDTEDSEISSESDYLDDVKKLYSRNDRKAENDRFTQSSRKLYDRMMSQAEIINKSYKNITKKEIDKPFLNDKDNVKKLGERKNIKKKY